MKKLFSLFVALGATLCLWAQNNVITYMAIGKLTETSSSASTGLHVNAFGVTMTSHTFSKGVGTITFSGDVTRIGEKAFIGCSSMTAVSIPDSVKSIGAHAFMYCYNLTSISLPNGVTTIGLDAFSNCTGLTSISLGNSVTSIGTTAFHNCSALTSITLPNTVTDIGAAAFENCSLLTTITIPNGITDINIELLKNCSGLTTITLPNTVTNIHYGAFNGCSSLTTIKIPDGVTIIGHDAFRDCSGLTCIKCESMVPPTLDNCFSGVSKSIPVYIPCGTMPVYLQASQWADFTNLQENCVPFVVSAISNNATYGSVSGGVPTNEGEEAVLEAIPNDGYHFTQWSDGSTDNPRTIVVTQDTAFVAYFAANQYMLTLTVNDENMGVVTGAGVYDYISVAEISAIPASGYEFVQWSDGSIYNPYTVTILEDMSLQAEFREIPNAFKEIETTSKVQKIFREDQILIIRDDKCYNLQGEEVKSRQF